MINNATPQQSRLRNTTKHNLNLNWAPFQNVESLPAQDGLIGASPQINHGTNTSPLSIHSTGPNVPVQIPNQYLPNPINSPPYTGLGKRTANHISERASPVDAPKHVSKKARTQLKDRSVANDPSEPHVIAHCPVAQGFIDAAGLAYGVRFEMARLIAMKRLRYEDISSTTLEPLKGSNARCAPETARTLLKQESPSGVLQDPAFSREAAAKSPWEELDSEEAALSKDEYAGLGHSKDNPSWYGGKVEFRGRIQKDGGSYKVTLDRCTLGPSCRFTRRFGSKKFLRIRIPADIFHASDNGLNMYFCKPFIIWDCVFRSFYAKDDTVFLIKTNEIMENNCIIPSRAPGLSLWEFLNWHNPLEDNCNQTMTKWSARFALGLSNSFPGPMISPENIGHEDDIISNKGSDMTDGCGFANLSVHFDIYHRVKCEGPPTAFQFRLQGAKGMCLKRNDTALKEEPKIYLRPSQVKIRYPTNKSRDPAHLIVEILRTSHMRSPARISAEIIINLAENGVPHAVFISLLKQSIAQAIDELTTWDGPDAMFTLWQNVERIGGVIHARRAREAVGEARVRGLRDRSGVEAEEDDDDDLEGLKQIDRALDDRSTPWWADEISGCPSSLEETVMSLLDAGFTPQESPILREKLKKVVMSRIKNKSQNFRYEILHSASAFVVPDPFGVLGVDEIQVKSSRRNLMNVDGVLTDIIVGDVLMTRNPCKLPTDVRKLRGVECLELRDYVDVIVCSVKGHRRLLDFLAGGDYDGDTAIVMWAPDLVGPFVNADEKYSEEPAGLDQCFSQDNEGVDAFLQRVKPLQEEEKVTAMQVFLLGALRDTSLVGMYSSMHDNCVYQRGYANPRSIRMAYKFCKILDSPKTGQKLKPTTLRCDIKEYYHSRGPEWKAKFIKTANGLVIDKSNSSFLRRGDGPFIKGGFIMDVLRFAAKKECDRCLARMDDLFSSLKNTKDLNLIRLWLEAEKMAKRGPPETIKQKEEDLEKIKLHVQTMYKEHKEEFKGKAKGDLFTNLAIETRQDVLRALSKKFAAYPRPEDLNSIMDETMIARLRASYAYMYDSEQMWGGWSRFPWNVAMRELCLMKASALGPYKTVTNGFYQRFKVISGYRS